MLRLKTLGSIDLRGDDGAPLDGVMSQPKRIALLAYLAVHGGAFCRRDTLLALLWPEADTDRARHSLRQAVYHLRRWVGPDVVVGRGEEELGIDPGRLWCDAVALRDLLKQGKTEPALDLYGGEFLAGFHAPDASEEFEDWVAATRLEQRNAAIRGAQRLTEEALAGGDVDKAVEFARWAAATDPLDEATQAELIKVLGIKGDKAGADRAFQVFADRLKRDVGTTPTPALRQALEAAQRHMPPATGISRPSPAPRAGSGDRRRPAWIVGAVVGLLVIAGAGLFITRGSSARPTTAVLAVAAIQQIPTAGDSSNLLPIADLLATSLARLPSMQVLSNARLIEVEQALKSQGQVPAAAEIARRARATELLEGSLYRIGSDSLVLELRQVDLASGRVRHGYRVGARDVFALVDRATAEIARVSEVQQPARSLADVTTGSLVAYRLYQEGLRSYYAGDIIAAKRFFETAVAEDSTFAMAMWYLARTSQVLTLPDVRLHYAAALRLAAAASDRERLLITADVMRVDTRSEAIAVAETLATRYPSDPEGVLLLGLIQATVSQFDQAARTIRRAIALDSGVPVIPGRACRLCDSYQGLIHIYLFTDSLDRAMVTAREFIAVLPREPVAWSTLGGVANLLDDTATMDSAQRVIDRLTGQPRGIGITIPLLGRIGRGHYLSADSALVSLGVLSEELRPELRWNLEISLRNQGRLRDAIALARNGILPAGVQGSRWPLLPDSLELSIALFEAGQPGMCIRFYRSLSTKAYPDLVGWPGSLAREQAWALARLAMCRAAAGDTARFDRLADSLEAIGRTSLYSRDQRLHHYVRGLLWKARGVRERAATEFRAAINSPNFGFTRINYELGTLLLSLNRPAEAVAVLQPALRGALDASNLYITRTELHERLAEAWEAAGQSDSARAHWIQVDRAWLRADPPFRTRWENAHRHAAN